MKVFSVDVGGSHIACGAVEEYRLLASVSIPANAHGPLENLLPRLAEAFDVFRSKDGGGYAGVAFGFCGLVDTRLGRVTSTNHKYPDATTIDLGAWARESLGLPLILENDSRLALLGERHAGAAAGSDNVVMMTLGTGIGSAVIMEGKLLHGKHGQAGCMGGHFTVNIEGHTCSCGGHGCFEAEASTYALASLCRSWPGIESSALATSASEETIDFATLFHFADLGDAVAQQIRDRCIKVWCACALSLVHAYDPELLIVGGGVMKSSYPILELVQQHLDRYAWTPWGKIEVRPAALGSNAALLGGFPLFHEYEVR